MVEAAEGGVGQGGSRRSDGDSAGGSRQRKWGGRPGVVARVFAVWAWVTKADGKSELGAAAWRRLGAHHALGSDAGALLNQALGQSPVAVVRGVVQRSEPLRGRRRLASRWGQLV
jgi:hypothetical protein